MMSFCTFIMVGLMLLLQLPALLAALKNACMGLWGWAQSAFGWVKGLFSKKA